MNIKDRMIMDEYRTKLNVYVELEKIVASKLWDIVNDAGMLVMGIEHRVKTEKSLEGKLYLRGEGYHTLSELTDILGARIICYFADEVDIIGNAIEKAFNIDRVKSSDKRKLIAANTFGYLSLHYICSLPAGNGYTDELCAIQFEIQIRTVLQHTWAAINHDLGYKSEFGVPRMVTRQFSRLAGLLEIADDEFMRTRDNMNSYTEETRSKIINDNAGDVLIDMISLREYVFRNKKMGAFLHELSRICNAEICEIDPESYIEQLSWLGKSTIGDVQNMLEENRLLAKELLEHSLASTDLDIMSSNVGLRYLCHAELLNKGYPQDKITEFIMISAKDNKRAINQSKRLLRTYDSIRKG